jgi:hypothetical protein
MKYRSISAAFILSVVAAPVSGQRLLEEWQVRPSAGADALVSGATAVFWNPSQVTVPAGVAELMVLDLRAPSVTGVEGIAAAGAYRLNGRTTLALGYEHVRVDGIERTTDSPDGGAPIDFGENRFAAAASHRLGESLRVGALVRYTRLPEISYTGADGSREGGARSVIALGAGVRYRPLVTMPLELAGMAATEGSETYWMAGIGIASGERWAEWQLRAEYGLAGGELAPGVTHRAAGTATWRDQIEVTLGAAVEPDGDSRSLQPVLGTALRLSRYRLGIVREQLPNEFGAAWSFSFGVAL